MINALLFNRIRGSDREVRLAFGDVGVEMQTAIGEPIAIWPYGVIDLRKESQVKGEGEFVADHDEIHVLRIVDSAAWSEMLAHAPRARRTEARTTSVLWCMFFGAPDSTVWVIWLLLIFGICTAASALYHWLF